MDPVLDNIRSDAKAILACLGPLALAMKFKPSDPGTRQRQTRPAMRTRQADSIRNSNKPEQGIARLLKGIP